ncbi:MAG: protein kinase domain-containing protein [Egibacteraceae bacterium]
MQPSAHCRREQGWKLHVAATRASATTVLERSLEVLLRNRCAFKFAISLDYAGLLNSAHYPRGGAGKFLTAYPDDDAHFRRVAEDLDHATAGLTGPTILSDRPYRAGGLVHYRYGAFVGRFLLSNDSDYLPVLSSPDGTLIEDRRDPWFSPPVWAPSPLGEDNGASVTDGVPGPVLLADRFIVRQAIRHANKGGVFHAVDTHTDSEVVIKQARPHVEANDAGWDVRDTLRHEAEMLDLLAPLGIAPRKIDLFEQEGHLFLAQELIPGTVARQWVSSQAIGVPGIPWPLAVDLTRQLVRLLRTVHEAGLVLRDLTPNNLLVDPDGKLRIIDLELAAGVGTAAIPAARQAMRRPSSWRVRSLPWRRTCSALAPSPFSSPRPTTPSYSRTCPQPARSRLAWKAG